MCSRQAGSFIALPAQRIEQMVQPTAQQQSAFDDLKQAAQKVGDQPQSSCPTAVPKSPVARLVVVVEILIAKRNPEHPLADQRHHLVLDQFRAPHVVKARGQSIHHPDRAIRCAQQQRSGIRRDRAPIERRHHRAAFNRFKSKEIRATLCRHRGAPRIDDELLRHNGFR
jgi:hypothetical protein